MASKMGIKSFRAILLYIQNNLNKEEQQNLVFLKELPQNDEEDCLQNMRNFWNYMSKRPDEFKYTEDDPSDLFDDLLIIGRQDVCNEVKKKYEQLKHYKQSRSRSQGHAPQSTPGPGSPPQNQLSPGSPDVHVGYNTVQGMVPHPSYLQSPGPSPTTPQTRDPPPYSPPNSNSGNGRERTSPGATVYEQPCKVPGLVPQGSMPAASPASGNLQQSPALIPHPPPHPPYLPRPGPSPTTPQTHYPLPYSPPDGNSGNGQERTSPGATAYEQPCKVPGLESQGSMPAAPPTSGNLQQSPALIPLAGAKAYEQPCKVPGTQNQDSVELSNTAAAFHSSPGLKSTEPLPTMPSNLVQRRGSPSDYSQTGMVPAHIGRGISLPGSLYSKERAGNPQRNVFYPSGSAFPIQPSSAQSAGNQGLRSSEPLPTMQSNMVPGQSISATPANLASVNSDSVISKASSLKTNDAPESGQSGYANAEQYPRGNMRSEISSPRSLKTGSAGLNQQSSPQQTSPAQASTLQVSGSTRHTLEHPIQPSSTPDHLRDNIGHLVDLSLDEAEEIALGASDTVKDNATSENNDLPTDVVRDSVSDLKQLDELAALTDQLAAPILDHQQSLQDKKGTVTLRGYQKELADPGLKSVNYVICAPTGSGKTITAAHICHENMIKMKKAGKEDDFKAIFIVPTRHLKKQQRDGFQNLFVPGQVTSLAEGQLFSEAFGKGNVRVLMITAQILVNALTQNQFNLCDATMLVFDECHHTTLNHPYNEIMRYYLKEKKAFLAEQGIPEEQWPVGRPRGRIPQVVGLTASVGTGTSGDAHGHIVTLCANLDSFGVKTVTKADNVREMNVYNKPPEKDQIISTPKKLPTAVSSRFIEILETAMQEIEQNVLAKHQNDYMGIKGITVYPPRYGTQDYENWIAKIRAFAELRFPNLEICANYLFRLNLSLMLYEDLRAIDALESMEIFKLQMKGREDDLRDARHCRLLYEKNLQELKELASKDNALSNPKLLCLHDLIKKIYSKEPESKGIVLARTRFATHALLNFIRESEELSDLDPPIQPVRIVGQSKEIDQGLTLAKQEGALSDFKSGRANLLVATDIVQEGLDIPACNVIIRYNFVSNEIGTVQSKGRARKEGSKCFLIVQEGSVNEAREHENRKRVEEMAKAIEAANALPPQVWHQQIRERQLTIIENIELKDELKRIQQEESKQVDVKLLCNKCEKFICKSSDLERRLSNYTCLDETIKERTTIVRTGCITFRESRTIGMVKCKCGNQLGQALEFKRLHVWKPGYNLSPKSFFFIYNNDPNSKRVFAKWKKADFPIASEE